MEALPHLYLYLASCLPLPAGGREADKDGWAHRDPMMKPWQDLVTHRLLLRSDGGSRSSNSGGGGRAGVVRLAKWHAPEDPAVIRFEIRSEGILLS